MKDKIKLLVAVTIFGTIGLVRKAIPYSSAMVAMARGLIGVSFLVILHFILKKRFDWNAIRKNSWKFAVSGVLLGLNWVLLFEAYRYTSVSVATICYYMAPIIVILAAPIVFHEPLTLFDGLCSVVALLGMVLVSGVLESGFTGLLGVIYGLAAATFYALIIILNKKIEGVGAQDRTVLQLGMAAVALLPYILCTEDLGTLVIEPLAVGMLLVAGIVHTGVAYALYFGSMSRVPAQTVALFSYIDPVLAIVLSAVVLKESMTIMTVIGVILVISAAFASEWRKYNENK